MPETLILPCFEISGDSLGVRTERARQRPVVSMTMRNGTADLCSHTMDAEQARQLFNWLGVWLHTQAKD